MRYLKFSSPLLLLLVLVLCDCSFSGHKSKRDMLIKKWRLLDIVDPDADAMYARVRAEIAVTHDPYLTKKMEEGERINKELKAKYPKITVEYKADSTYIENSLLGLYTGKWSLSADGRRLTELNDPDSSGAKWLTVTHEVEISEDRLVIILEKSTGSTQKDIYEPNQ